MKVTKCSTQAKLDVALKDPNVWPALVGDGDFEISGSASVTAWDRVRVRASGTASVQAWNNASVIAIGSASVQAWGNVSVIAGDNVSVIAGGTASVIAGGKANVQAWSGTSVVARDTASVVASDNASVIAGGNASVTAADNASVIAVDNASVRAWGSASVTVSDNASVRASKFVAVTKRGKNEAPRTLSEWFENYGVVPENGVVVLYKAVGSDWTSEHGQSYAPGTCPVASDWNGGREECGGGFFFCADPALCLAFYEGAKRFVACPILVEDIAFHERAQHPTKVKARAVCSPGCYEVDVHARRIS